jgi:aryl-alcohol dehydrogenase-like predicted oxidoreductase
MRYKKLGNSDLEVSVVGLGTWAMGGDFWGDADDDDSIKAIQRAIDRGINFIDTAAVYGCGHAEEIVGKAIKGHRDQLVIATKCGVVWDEEKNLTHTLNADSMAKELDASLMRLGTDYVDLYQIHWPDAITPIEEAVDTMRKLKETGKARYIGVSNFSLQMLKQAMTITEITSYQMQYSLLHRDENDSFNFCKDNNIGVISYGSLYGGILSGKYKARPKIDQENDNRAEFYHAFVDDILWAESMQLVEELRKVAAHRKKTVGQVAINWVNQQDKISTALVGSRTMKQVDENALAGTWELTRGEIKQINKAYEKTITPEIWS